MPLLEVLENTTQLLVVRERSWWITRKTWMVIAIPAALVPFVYGLSYARDMNWLALFFLVNGIIQLLIIGTLKRFTKANKEYLMTIFY